MTYSDDQARNSTIKVIIIDAQNFMARKESPHALLDDGPLRRSASVICLMMIFPILLSCSPAQGEVPRG